MEQFTAPKPTTPASDLENAYLPEFTGTPGEDLIRRVLQAISEWSRVHDMPLPPDALLGQTIVALEGIREFGPQNEE